MHGKMLWFNTEKEHGFIQTEDGERLYVHRTGFVDEKAPVGRCAGKRVRFERQADDEGARAVETLLLELVEPRRARLRHRQGVRH